MTYLRFSFLLLAFTGSSQAQVITRVAGTGQQSFFGDGGPATQAWLFFPEGLAADGAGNIFIADNGNERVREVNTSGIINTVAGNGSTALTLVGQSLGDGGPATSASFDANPATLQGLAIDSAGNLYITDGGNNRIRKVSGGIITTYAGGGSGGDGSQANQASLRSPNGIAVDSAGNLYIADTLNGRVRKVDTSGTITTVAGSGSFASSGDGGLATSAGFAGGPLAVAVDSQGNLYIAENQGFKVRKVNSAGIISTVAGSARASPAMVDWPPARSSINCEVSQ